MDVNEKKILEEDVYRFWFDDPDLRRIIIVASKESNPPFDAYNYSNNYAYMDAVGDKDLVLAVSIFLARYYPKANIEILFSEDFETNTSNYYENLVVIGGPNRNKVCKTYMSDRRISSHVLYPPKKPDKERICLKCTFQSDENKCNSKCLCVGSNILCSEKKEFFISNEEAEKIKLPEKYRINKDEDLVIITCVEKDYGIFISMINPEDSNCNNRIIFINGIHTFGGVGAFKAFAYDSIVSKENYKVLKDYMNHVNCKDEFICYMPVEIRRTLVKNPIKCPSIDKSNIFPLVDEVLYCEAEPQLQVFEEVNLNLVQRDLLVIRDKAKDILDNGYKPNKHNDANKIIQSIEDLLLNLRTIYTIDEAIKAKERLLSIEKDYKVLANKSN